MSFSLTRSQTRFTLFLLIAAAALLRFHHLSVESLWVDETYTLRIARKTIEGVLANVDVHPPLYYAMMHFWVKLFGSTEFALRSLSALFGIGAVWMVYRLGRLLFDRATGVVAALLIGLSSFHVMYSQEARSYSFLTFMGAASFYFFIRMFRKPNFKVILGYMLTSLGLLYTHNFGALVLIAQNVWVFGSYLFGVRQKGWPLPRWIVLQAILFVCFIPWILSSIGYSKTVSKNFWIAPPSPKELIMTVREYSGGAKAMVLSALALAFGSLSFRRESAASRRGVCLLAVWVLTGLAVPYVISVLWTPIFYTRYTIITSIPYYLLVGWSVTRIQPKAAVWAFAAVLGAISLSSVALYDAEQKKEDWRATAGYVDAASKPGDLLLFHLSGHEAFGYYSRKAEPLKTVLFPIREQTAVVMEESKKVTPEAVERLSEYLEGAPRVWLILSHSRDKEELIVQKLESLGYRRKQGRTFAPLGVKARSWEDSRVIELSLYEKS